MDDLGAEDIKMVVLYSDWVSNQVADYVYSDYVLLTGFCAIAGIDSSEYEKAGAVGTDISALGDYYDDENITSKPGEEINSYFSITGYGEFATVMQYMPCVPAMEAQFYYWVGVYANRDWSEYETCATFASEFGIRLDW